MTSPLTDGTPVLVMVDNGWAFASAIKYDLVVSRCSKYRCGYRIRTAEAQLVHIVEDVVYNKLLVVIIDS